MIICAECGRELASLNEPHDEKDHIIRKFAEHVFRSEVLDTQMEEYLIGPGKEYADKEDWIASWVEGVMEEGNQR